MAIVTGTALESNKNFRVNFDGGNLSSDGGLLLLKEFYHKLGVKALLKKRFHTTDPASFRIHKDHENLLQMLYQITLFYVENFAGCLFCSCPLRHDTLQAQFRICVNHSGFVCFSGRF